ncbi:MAG: hypothetical protein HKP58_02825 [Desulfatitalea sp.]|nr:cytochrome C oxidase subunit IV family protein [Desulfatitalea sp.]NNJ99325.1 hypothetical protein [Desulfatitalea sp.]
MMTLLRTSITPVFFLLLIGTLVSWWAGIEGANGMVVMTISMIKSFLVGMFFMELLHAPGWLKRIWQSWCIIAEVAFCAINLATTMSVG